MNQEIQENLWRLTDDKGMLLNWRKSLTLRQATETGISGILNGKLLNLLSFEKNGRIGNLTRENMNLEDQPLNRVRYFRGRVTNFHQSEARKHCFLAFDWLKFETLPRKYRTQLRMWKNLNFHDKPLKQELWGNDNTWSKPLKRNFRSKSQEKTLEADRRSRNNGKNMSFTEITGSASLAANCPLSYLGKQLNIEYFEKKATI